MRQVLRRGPLPAVVVVTLVFAAGCADPYHSLSTVRQVPELASLQREARAIPRTTVRVNAAAEGRPPLELALHETNSGRRERVVVMIHGLMSDSGVWRFVRPRLAGDYDLIAVDLPGCGGSDAPRPKKRGGDCYAPDAMARAVLASLRQRLAGRPAGHRVTLVGHSLGGMLILRMMGDPAVRSEFDDVLGRVDGLVLLTPVDVAIEKDQPLFRDLATVGPTTIFLGEVTGLMRQRVAASIRDGVGEGCVAVREEADRTIAVLRHPMQRRAMQSIIRQAVPFKRGRPVWSEIDKIVARYADVDVPCLVLWGARDELFPVSMGYKVAAEVPGARLRVVPRAMHSLPTERPTLCADLVRRFVEGADDDGPRFAWLDGEGAVSPQRPQYLAARRENAPPAPEKPATPPAAPPVGRQAALARSVGHLVELLIAHSPSPVSFEAVEQVVRGASAAR